MHDKFLRLLESGHMIMYAQCNHTFPDIDSHCAMHSTCKPETVRLDSKGHSFYQILLLFVT